jgi:hypothetical protein
MVELWEKSELINDLVKFVKILTNPIRALPRGETAWHSRTYILQANHDSSHLTRQRAQPSPVAVLRRTQVTGDAIEMLASGMTPCAALHVPSAHPCPSEDSPAFFQGSSMCVYESRTPLSSKLARGTAHASAALRR